MIRPAPQDIVKVMGIVQEARPNATFWVKLENGHELLAFPSGNMRRFRIRIVPGDTVELEVSKHDLSKGRIVFRKR